MRWIAAPLLALALLLPFHAHSAAPAGAQPWKLVSDRDGIQIFMAHNDESRIKTFRGVTSMEIDDYYSLAALLDDQEYYPRWLYLIRSLTVIRQRSPIDRDYYVVTKLPWPVADRDAGLQFVVEQDPQTHEFRVMFKAREGLVKNEGKYVRIPEMTGHFNALPIGGKKVRLEFQVMLDPGGYIPAFLANFILKDIPFVSLQRVRRILNTERFKGHVVDWVQPPEPWASQPH